MTLWKKVALGITALCILLLGAVVLFLGSLADGMCGNETLAEYPSSNGHLKAVVFERDCGATTGFSTQVSILPISSALENEAGNLFVANTDHGRAPSDKGGGPEIRFRWVSDTNAELQHHRHARIFRADGSVKGHKSRISHSIASRSVTYNASLHRTMTDTEARIIAAWKEAAADLGIQFTAPFIVTIADGRTHEYLGLVHRFGRRIGTLIKVLDEPSGESPCPEAEDYCCSILGPGYTQYDRQLFIDTLDDWQFLGPESECPGWYSGKSWT